MWLRGCQKGQTDQRTLNKTLNRIRHKAGEPVSFPLSWPRAAATKLRMIIRSIYKADWMQVMQEETKAIWAPVLDTR
jgi:hypothetical protein